MIWFIMVCFVYIFGIWIRNKIPLGSLAKRLQILFQGRKNALCVGNVVSLVGYGIRCKFSVSVVLRSVHWLRPYVILGRVGNNFLLWV